MSAAAAEEEIDDGLDASMAANEDDEEVSGNNVLEVPLDEDANETIEIDLDVTDVETVVEILKQEKAGLGFWHKLAIHHYRSGNTDALQSILEEADANVDVYAVKEGLGGDEAEMDGAAQEAKLKVFTTLGSHYTQVGSKAFGAERKALLAKATAIFNKADQLQIYTSKDNLVGRGYLYLADGALGKAERNFKYVLASIAPNDIPALLGNACLQFNQGKFTEALDTYRKVLRLHPKCPASVRVGIGMCFARMKVPEKAMEAFTRALELDPENATALVGSAVLHSNEKTPEAMKRSLRTLKKAYDADNRNPLTLNQLAEHFFRKKEFQKTLTLAKNALKHTDVNAVKSESHYHIARVLHAKGSYDEAFRHYHQATKLYSSFPLPLYGLGQIYLHKSKRVEAIECFEKVLKTAPKNYETRKILGSLYGQSDNAAKKKKGKQYLEQVTKQQPEDVEAWIELAIMMQHTEKAEALSAYQKAIGIIKEQLGEVDCPELLDNVACLQHQLGQYTEAYAQYTAALSNCEASKARQTDEIEINYYQGLSVTIRYNMARLVEGGHAVHPLPRVMEVKKAFTPPEGSDYLALAVGQSVTVSKAEDGSLRGTVIPAADAGDADAGDAGDAGEAELHPASMKEHLASGTPSAKQMYEGILVDHEDYSDCYMRLGCIERDAGRLREADGYFKQGLRYNKCDGWTLLGNMNMAKKEYNPAQKKFEQILQDRDSKDDPYSMLSLGNIWLDWAPSASAEKRPVYLKRAFDHFRAVLLKDPHNVFATHGIGCYFALQGRLAEAKDIFIQVREAATDTPEPWLNLAHIYFEQRSYENSMKLYENCLKRFYPKGNAAVFTYLARAALRAKKHASAKEALLHAAKMTPNDTLIQFNIGLTQLAAARSMLEQDDQKLATVDEAIDILREARTLFGELKALKTKQKFSASAAEKEERRANDFLQNAKQRKGRVEKMEVERHAKEEALTLQKATFQEQLEDAKKKTEVEAKEALEAKAARIKTFQRDVVDAKELLNIDITKKEKKVRGKRKARQDDDDDGVIDDDEVVEGEGGAAPTKKKQKKRAPKKKPAAKKKRLNRGSGSDDSDSDSDDGIVTETAAKKGSRVSNKSFKSAAVISDSDSDDK
eukprot:gene5564-32385_t